MNSLAGILLLTHGKPTYLFSKLSWALLDQWLLDLDVGQKCCRAMALVALPMQCPWAAPLAPAVTCWLLPILLAACFYILSASKGIFIWLWLKLKFNGSIVCWVWLFEDGCYVHKRMKMLAGKAFYGMPKLTVVFLIGFILHG